MAEDEVFQDSAAMKEIANGIQSDKARLDKLTEDFYALINENITEEDNGNSSWFGPSANGFAEEVNKERKSFETASANMQTLANSLNEHAETWTNFENSNK